MERPYKAYDANGNEFSYVTPLDARQACEFAGYTLTRPGADVPLVPSISIDYDNKNSDEIRTLCMARGIVGYRLLDRKQQIAALREMDRQDEINRREGAKLAKDSKASDAKKGK